MMYNSNIINVPITINDNEYNIKIEINEDLLIKNESSCFNIIALNNATLSCGIERLCKKLGCESSKELNELIEEDKEKIYKLLIEQIDSVYKDNLKFVKRKLEDINDEEYKNKVIKDLYEIVKKSYKDKNINKNILLYLAKLLNSETKDQLSLCTLSRPNNDPTQKIDYKIIYF